jgi:hypothetical protein
VSWLLLASCERHCELTEVPVRGGTDEQQQIVASTMVQMQEAVVPPVCVDHVRLGSVWWHTQAEGVYNTVTRGIRLDREVDEETLVDHLRHELCHAVDVQNDLIEGGRDAREDFAFTCQVGPEPLSVLWGDCPLDPDLEGTWRVQREVYGLSAEPPPQRAQFERIGATGLVGASELIDVFETDGTLLVELIQEEDRQALAIDPWTGAVQVFEGMVPGAEQPSPPAPAGWSTRYGGMMDEQTGLVVAYFSGWEGGVRRMLAWTEEGWAPAQGPCPNESTRLFLYGSELWSAQLDGVTLSWGRWVPLPADVQDAQ